MVRSIRSLLNVEFILSGQSNHVTLEKIGFSVVSFMIHTGLHSLPHSLTHSLSFFTVVDSIEED